MTIGYMKECFLAAGKSQAISPTRQAEFFREFRFGIRVSVQLNRHIVFGANTARRKSTPVGLQRAESGINNQGD